MTQLEKLEELIYKGFKETDRRFKETDSKFKETRIFLDEVGERIDKLGVQVGRITDNLGRFAESMVAPAVVKLFRQRGIQITEHAVRVASEIRNIEYDIVAFNTEYVVVVSVKLTLRVNDVKEFVEERLPIFKDVFPRYNDMKVLGAVAGTTILGKSDIYAMKQGLYVLTQSGENITMLNDETFIPKVY